MPNDKKPNEPIRVTDKRIFTADGDLKDEYQSEVGTVGAAEQPPAKPSAPVEPPSEPRSAPSEPALDTKPDPRFLMLLDLVAANLSNALEVARRGQPEGREASHQLIDILDAIEEKTKGNLAAEEVQSLRTLTGEAKLRFVQLTKDIKV